MLYQVFWETNVNSGCPYYSGVENVEIEQYSEEDADVNEDHVKKIARHRVWFRGFRDYSKNHIRIKSIKQEK